MCKIGNLKISEQTLLEKSNVVQRLCIIFRQMFGYAIMLSNIYICVLIEHTCTLSQN